MRECRIALRSCHVSTKRAVTELATRVMIMIPEKTIVKSENPSWKGVFLCCKKWHSLGFSAGQGEHRSFLVSLRLHKTDRLYAHTHTSICIYTHIYVYLHNYTVYVYVWKVSIGHWQWLAAGFLFFLKRCSSNGHWWNCWSPGREVIYDCNSVAWWVTRQAAHSMPNVWCLRYDTCEPWSRRVRRPI